MGTRTDIGRWLYGSGKTTAEQKARAGWVGRTKKDLADSRAGKWTAVLWLTYMYQTLKIYCAHILLKAEVITQNWTACCYLEA